MNSSTSSTALKVEASPQPDVDIGAMYRAHGHVVLRRAQTLLADEQEAYEVLQEVFLALLRDPSQFEGRSSVTTWLYRVTTNRCLNRLRNQQNRQRLIEEHVVPAARGMWQESAVAWAEARQFVTRMPDELAKVTIFHSVDGMTHHEIAKVMKCSRRHVGNLLKRAQMWAQAQDSDEG